MMNSGRFGLAWVTRREILVVVLALSSLSCRPDGPPWPAACAQPAGKQLVLSPVVMVSAPVAEPPRAVVRLEGQRIAYLTVTDYVVLGEVSLEVADTIARVPGIRGIFAGHGTVMAFTDSTIFGVSGSDPHSQHVVLLLPSGEGSIRGVASNARGLWLLIERGGRYRLQHRDVDMEITREFRTPGDGRLHRGPGTSVFFAQGFRPFQVTRFDEDGSRFSYPVVGGAALRGETDEDLVVGLPPLPLECGYVLHTLADLQSDRRMLVLYEGATSAIRREVLMVEPFGLVQSDPDSILIGFRDAPGGREIALFKWTWS